MILNMDIGFAFLRQKGGYFVLVRLEQKVDLQEAVIFIKVAWMCVHLRMTMTLMFQRIAISFTLVLTNVSKVASWRAV